MSATKPIRRLLLTAVLAATCLGNTQSIASAETQQPVPIPQDTDKVPFRPALEQNGFPLCEILLDRASEAFASNFHTIDIRGSDLGDKAKWVFTRDGARKFDFYYKNGSLRLLGVHERLEGGETGIFYAWTKNSRSYKGPFHEIRVYSDIESFFADLANADTRSTNHWNILANGDWNTSSGAAPELIEYGKRLYFLFGYRAAPHSRQDTLYLSRINAETMQRETVCRISLKPKNVLERAPKSVRDIFAHLKKIVGQKGNGGTSQAFSRQLSFNDGIPERVLLRPWVMPFTPDNDLEYVKESLSVWSFRKLRNSVLYQQLLGMISKVRADLAAYYQANFPYSREEAIKLSNHLVDWMIAAHFAFNPHSNTETFYQPIEELNHAILSNAPANEVEDMFDRFVAEGSNLAELSSSTFRNSLERRDVMEFLLSKGADINKGNSFGKTPLMLAAHLNMPDAVKWLIAHGADVNSSTTTGSGYEVSVNIGGRTALFYAAENASSALILDLIAADANLNASDTKNRDVLDYLDLNEHLSDEERETLRQEILTARGRSEE